MSRRSQNSQNSDKENVAPTKKFDAKTSWDDDPDSEEEKKALKEDRKTAKKVEKETAKRARYAAAQLGIVIVKKSLSKIVFTQCYTWQNFGSQLLCLVHKNTIILSQM